jgi:hypothetical protein
VTCLISLKNWIFAFYLCCSNFLLVVPDLSRFFGVSVSAAAGSSGSGLGHNPFRALVCSSFVQLDAMTQFFF